MLLNCGVGEDLSPLNCKEIKLVNSKGNQTWIFIGRTDAKLNIPILWPPDVKSWFIMKDPYAGKVWMQEEKGKTGWDAWKASPTQWTWVWASSGRWWWTYKSGMLQSMGSQKIRHNWGTKQQCDPAIPFLDIYLEEMKTLIRKDICITKTWK